MRVESRQVVENSSSQGEAVVYGRPVKRVVDHSTQTLDVTPVGGFLPWSLPAALCLVLGILLGFLQVPWWAVLLVTGGVAGVGALMPLAHKRLLLITLVCLPLGAGRYQLWQQQPRPLAESMGLELTVSGVSDGRYLRVTHLDNEPLGSQVQVALSPRGAVNPGQVTLRGTLREAPGKRNPGGFDYKGYLERRGVQAQFLVREVISLQQATPGLRDRLALGVSRNLNERASGLMLAMTLGLREDLGDLREVFAASGLAHILALSGLHVGILIAAVGVLLKPLGQRRYPVMILFALGFVLLVGATPSVMRAGLMASAILCSLWLGSGRIEAWGALSLAALVTLLYNPSWLFDLSFQLSYLAVMGILLFSTAALRRLFGPEWGLSKLAWWDWRALIVTSAVVSASAQALSLPLVASTFGAVPLFSPLVNIIAVPLATLLVPLGFLAGALGLLWLPLAGLVNILTGAVAWLLIGFADLTASLPTMVWGEVSATGYLLYATGTCALILVLHRKLRPWRALLVMSTAILASMTLAESDKPEVIFFDVGQGDGALIRLNNRVDILVDGGGSLFSDFDVGKNIVVPALRALGVSQLELVIATHAHTDHIEGLITVLDLVRVQQLIIGIEDWGHPVFDELMASAQRNRVPVMIVTRGESITIGNAQLDILNPPKRRYGSMDADSIVFVLNLDDEPRALFLGDTPKLVEYDIAFPQVDIMKVGHHGSRHSTSDSLMLAARPQHAVISYGRNNYGHPNAGVLETLTAHGATVHETFLSGAVRLPLGR